MLKILFASSEAYPLMKTGGLGDVSSSLPRALTGQRQQVRLIMPAYGDAVARAGRIKTLYSSSVGEYSVTLRECILPGSRLKTWLVDCPQLFGRAGNPYLNEEGSPWEDNAVRFKLFSDVVVSVALNQAGLKWQPDIVHCNDWQTGLVPALLDLQPRRPSTVFTIHNLAYQGLFPADTFNKLKLPHSLWHYKALEYHNKLSFIKGGLVFADQINTVSPTYAEEIQTPGPGCGLDSLLRHRKNDLSGILNGISKTEWDPNEDPHITEPYGKRNLSRKIINKRALRQEVGLPQETDTPLFGSISRLVEQKGIDILHDILPELVNMPLQLVILGSGDKRLESSLSNWAKQYPERIAVKVGYDEPFAHRIEAGADIFLMPSRFEPCGLNQLYSMRYGTIPLVHKTGGLADTVVHATSETLENKTATGIVFENAGPTDLLHAIVNVMSLYEDQSLWRQLQFNGMGHDYSWRRSAREYMALYQLAIRKNPKPFAEHSI
ncbi:MAG: glycogen synthase GlgA [Gammaproteobacteria bacterium]|nr:MAG: glycogen synthase GlgA [Gammaproteobacteria bacterium]